MGTHATIALKENNHYRYIYLHYDGYPSHVLPILQEHYTTIDKVKTLIDLGNLSVLKPRIAPNPDEIHTFDKPLPDVTIAYHRDRDEDWCRVKPKTDSNLNTITRQEQYTYIFDPTYDTDKPWTYVTNHF